MSRRAPVLKFKDFFDSADFAAWQIANPTFVIFNTQAVFDSGALHIVVVYTEHMPDEGAKVDDTVVIEPVPEKDPSPSLT